MTFLRVYGRALKMLWVERFVTIFLLLAGVGAALIQLYEPVLFGRVIDTLSHGRASADLLYLWVFIGISNVIVSVLQAVLSDRLAHRRRLTILGQVFERAIALPFSFHAEYGSGRVVRAILAGTDQLFALWLTFVREHLTSLVGIAILVPMAIRIDWRIASVLLGLAAIYFVINWFVLNRTVGRQARVETYHQDVFGRVGDVIGNVTVVQSYTRLVDETRALQEIMGRLLNAQYPVLNWYGVLNVITRVSSTLTMVVIVGFGSYLVGRGELSVGDIVAFTGFSTLLIAKLDQISSFVSRALLQLPTLQNFFDLLDRGGSAVDSPNARPLTNVNGEVRFENVTFHYAQRKQGVRGLEFVVPAGQTIALVGPSGSGKTTTLALLQRLYDPEEGVIKIDGHDIREFTLETLRQNIASVFQDSGLFNRSIAENIRVGRPSATDAEVEDAARRASAHEFIVDKPGGYEFVIGERGSLLSGGERQRIAIARAILKNAPILIFDEATSALDNETEKKIQQAVTSLRAHKTTFMIAHRLSTVVSADHILVFEHGRIVESGSFAELSQKGGVFTRLLEAGQLMPEKQKVGIHLS